METETGLMLPPARDTTDHQQSPDMEEGKSPSLEFWKEMCPCWHLDFVLLASGVVRKWISVILRNNAGDLLQQSQEPNTKGDQHL